MKALNRAIDRFCTRHPGFGVRNLMLYIIIGNAIVFLFSMMDSTNQFVKFLALYPAEILRGQVWRIFTFIFVPDAGSLITLALFLYFYYFIGRALEMQWGKGRFLIYYLSGVAITVICSFILHFAGREVVVYGASYINLSMFFAYATLFPEHRVLLFFFIPLKVKWLAIADAVFFLIEIFTGGFPVCIFPIAAVLNYFVFCGETLFGYFTRRPKRYRPNVVDFQQARKAAEQRAEQQSSPYERKCAVCGRKADEHPELDFRYCSQCAGYHCFCEEHINSHIHFTE